MPTKFLKFKTTKNRVLYRQANSTKSLRFDAREFVNGAAPDAIEVGGEGVEFAPVSSGASVSKVDMPAEVKEAAEKLAAYKADQKRLRDERLTPEQKAKRAARDAKRAEAKAAKKAAREAAKAAQPASSAPAPAQGAKPATGKLPTGKR